jgi:predicted porin
MKKKLLTAAIASALVAPMAANAIEYSISGHVNRMIRFADDGKASEIQQLDNAASQTRIRWRGTGDIGRGMKAGILIETGVSSSNSSNAPIKANNDDPGSDTAFNIRHSRLDFSGKWGKVTLGHTSPAGDGIADQDLSGTGIAAGYDITGDTAGGIEWRSSSGGFSGITVGDTRATLDGGRRDVLRYDSPALGPVTIAASVSNDNYWDIAVYGNTSLGGGTLAFAGGYIKEEQRTSPTIFVTELDDCGCEVDVPTGASGRGHNSWGLSAAYLFSQGTSVQGTYSETDEKASGAKNASNWAVKLGHKWGNNAVSAGYGEGSDLVQGVDHESFQIGFVHQIPKPGVELYAGYHFNSLSLDTATKDALEAETGDRKVKDVNVFFVGSRIQFN